jgi:hypothetical protein
MPSAPKWEQQKTEGERCNMITHQAAISEAKYRPKTMIKALEQMNSFVYFGHNITCET